MKKNNAVVFGLTANHVFAVASVMMDLKRLSPGLVDEVVIIHDGIKEQDQKLLNSILPSRFMLYDFPITDKKVLKAGAVQYFTKMVFTKYECLRLLDDYKNVMWQDYDIIISGDISELFQPCESGIKMMPGGLPVRGQLHEEITDYDMDAEGISGAVFVVHDNLKDYSRMYQFCYEKTEKYATKLYMPEQAIFDFMIQEFGLVPVPIDGRVYCVHPLAKENVPQAKIIHAYGQPKFWNGIHNDQWEENYKQWLQMGGSKYKPPSIISGVIRKSKGLLRRIAF